MKNSIDFNTPGKVAMFLAEPIQGAGGVCDMPEGFTNKAVDHARAAGGIYAADEVQTGFARVGTHYWGFEALGVNPDIVVMAKTMGNGMPIAAVATTKEIANCLDRVTLSTYAANPLAITASREVLKIIDEEGLQENCRLRGEQFISGLKELQKRYECIGHVRGQGLMVGVELVKDKESKTPADRDFAADVFEKTKDYGMLCSKTGRYGNILRFLPPLCVTEDDIDFALDVLDISIKEAYKNKKK